MDDEAKQLLREIRDLQREQIELLRTYLLPPWMRWRFSLRSLLIAMTLVAVVLGLIAVFSIKRHRCRHPSPFSVR